MWIFLSVLVIVCVVLSIPISIILSFVTKAKRDASVYLSIAFFSTSCYALSYLFFLNNWILDYPVSFRIFNPFCYLIAPCIYLYMGGYLKFKFAFSKWRWLNFLPFFITLIDILPWLLMSHSDRYQAVLALVEGKVIVLKVTDSYIPTWVHFVARPLQGVIYLCFQSLSLLFGYFRHRTLLDSARYKMIFRWLLFFTVLEWIMYITLLLFTVVMFLSLDEPQFIFKITYISTILMCFPFLIAGFYLYLNPELLYGRGLVDLRQMAERDDFQPSGPGSELLPSDSGWPDDKDKALPLSLSREVLLGYQASLMLELVEHELFRQHGLTVVQLAAVCKIPARAMSYLLSKIYQKGFNDFVNDYRLDFIEKEMREGRWKDLTMEGMAKEAGFSSRATFYLAFKKRFHMTPSDFIRGMK